MATFISTPQPPYPLSPSIEPRLDPEYASFYKQNLVYKQQVQYQPLAQSRAGAPVPGAGPLQPVGDATDHKITRREGHGPDIAIRVFTPEGVPPLGGWPVMLWLHGGGWVLGSLDTENVVCTHLCRRVGAVVVTPDYRLAPEHPFPAAVHDAWETLLYLYERASYDLSTSCLDIAIGGSSAGGNLALILAQRALFEPRILPHKIKTVLLSVPVTDNTANTINNRSWRRFAHTPALPAEKMEWYRRLYLPNEEDRQQSEASPIKWTGDWYDLALESASNNANEASSRGALPRTVILVGELDVLRAEAEDTAHKIARSGGNVRLEVMRGMPHPFLAMDGELAKGREAINIFCSELADAFRKSAVDPRAN